MDDLGRIQAFGKVLGIIPFRALEKSTQENYAETAQRLLLFLLRIHRSKEKFPSLPVLPENINEVLEEIAADPQDSHVNMLWGVFFRAWETDEEKVNHPLLTFLKVAANRGSRMAGMKEVRHWLVALVWVARLTCFWKIMKVGTDKETMMKTVNPE